MNYGFCNKCKGRVPVSHVERGGKEYIEKQCSKCGKTCELVSNNSSVYRKKQALMKDVVHEGCHLNCLGCEKHALPNIVFVETTNRCNMNCPICITNVPSMGFEFEPRMEYFEKIFNYYASFEFPPSIQLFGGEPTMRDDLLDIIALARSKGLSVRLVTNGLKLADPVFCEKIVESGASILISFDGLQKEMYEKLRGFAGALDLKLKALSNIAKHKKGKVILMTVIDKNMNADDMPKFLDYCLENASVVRGIFPMPLTQVWSEGRLDYKPERTTPEDVERIVDNAVEGKVEFIPLGSLQIKNLARIFKLRHLPFLGVHPNCESFTLLVSNGKKYIALSNFMKRDLFSFVSEIRKIDARAGEYLQKARVGGIRKAFIGFAVLGVFLRYLNFGGVVGAKGLKAFGRWMLILGAIITGRKFKEVMKRRTLIKGILQILILPFEDDLTQESVRLEKCSSGSAYIDVETGEIRSVPTCVWEKYKDAALRSNAIKYNKPGFTKGLVGDDKKKEEVKGHA